MKFFSFFLLLMSFLTQIEAQSIVSTSLNRIDPYTIITDNYTKIDNCEKEKLFKYDSANPYTYIQIITDEKGNVYQLLYQTDFLDKINFWAISNNYNISCFKEKSIEFCRCMNRWKDESISSIQTSDMLDCLIETIRKCAD